MPEQILIKLGMITRIMVTEPISTAYVINPSHQFLCLYVHPNIVARQRLGNRKHATMEVLLEASLSLLPVSNQWRVGDYFFPEFLVL
jgi:hypothetical protein